jgi:integrase
MTVYKRDGKGLVIKNNRSAKPGETWFYDFTIDGRRYKKALRGIKTKSDAEKLETQAAFAVHAGSYGKGQEPIGFEKFANEVYLPQAKHSLKAFKDYSYSVKSFCAYFKNKLLSEIAPADIEAFRQNRIETPTINKRGKRNLLTINSEMMRLSSVFSLAVRLEYLSANPCSKVKRFKVNGQRTRALTPQEVRELVDKASDRYRPLILIAIYTGMRLNEVINLKWGWIDWESKAVTLPATLTKNKKARTVPLIGEALRVLEETRAQSKGQGAVFTGIGYKRGTVSKNISQLCDELKMPDVTFHTLRHSVATFLAAEGVSPMHIQRILGQSSYAVTDGYVHPGDNSLREDLKKLESRLARSNSVPVAPVGALDGAL